MALQLLTAEQSALFAKLINEAAAAPQNQLEATLVDRMLPLAVHTGAPSTGYVKDMAEESPMGMLLYWAQNSWYMNEMSQSWKDKHQLIVDAFRTVPNTQLHGDQAERLLEVMEAAGFIENDAIGLQTLKDYPYAALLAWVWWMNVPDTTLPFPWCQVEA